MDSEEDEDASMEQVDSSSPKRKRVRIDHMTSPEVRRKLIKMDNCKFCDSICDRTTLEAHLQESNLCFQCYLKDCNAQSLETVLVRLFPCLFCDKQGQFKLKIHLEEREDCFANYSERWNTSTVQ